MPKKILHLLTGVVLAAGIASPALASSSYIILNPYFGMPGMNVLVSGYRFVSDSLVSLFIGHQNFSAHTDSSGNFVSNSFTIPIANINQTLPVSANDSASNVAGTNLVVGNYYPFVAPDGYYVLPGGSVIFSGSRFAPNENVFVESGGNVLAVLRADSNGAFQSQRFSVGYAAGDKSYKFTGLASNASFTTAITVGKLYPWLTLSTYYAPHGSYVTIYGHSFGVNEPVHVLFQGIEAGTVNTDSGGNFSIATMVLPYGGGNKTISANGLSSGLEAATSFSESF